MNNSKVSIIIPVYNAEKYLYECINSVINQTYKNLELIIINDGSTDSSDIICKNVQRLDNRILYYYQENNGVSAARNKGISIAQGAYIAFIDADDILSQTYIEQLVYMFENNDIQMASVAYTRLQDNLRNSVVTEIEIFSADIVRSNMMDVSQCRFTGYVWGKMFLASIVKQQVVFNELISVREDLLFIINYLTYSDKCGYVENELYFYRENNNSVLNSMTSDKIYTQLLMSEIVLKSESSNSKLYFDALDAYYESGRRYIEYLSKEKKLSKEVKNEWVKKQIKHFKNNKSLTQIKRIVASIIQSAK